ncbi:antibiotic biosynthesis monooxygenase [Streptomyces capparidis]
MSASALPGATLPDMTRPGVGAPFFSRWSLGTPQRQRAAVEAVAAAWEGRPWPTPGLLGYHVYTGTDGDTLMHHSQWVDDDAYEAFAAAQRPERVAEIDEAVPGLRRLALHRTRRHRAFVPAAADDSAAAGAVGCVVLVVAELKGPDPRRQREWANAVCEALETDPSPPPGLLSAHFHLSTDGTEIVNYAEWTSERAHADALAATGFGIGSPTRQWRRVRDFPGVRRTTMGRYHLAWSGTRP